MVQIKIVPVKEWPKGKTDPTEYSYDTKTIRVRSDYDDKLDPAGWIVHEKIHSKYEIGKDPYPDNPIEEEAYKAQFKYLKEKGYDFHSIFTISTFKHKIIHKDLFKRWWNEI